jgi:hypothetical protein
MMYRINVIIDRIAILSIITNNNNLFLSAFISASGATAEIVKCLPSWGIYIIKTPARDLCSFRIDIVWRKIVSSIVGGNGYERPISSRVLPISS